MKKLSILEYIKDPRFLVQGVGIKTSWGMGPLWVSALSVKKVLQTFDWAKASLCAHNVCFDGAILAWHYGIRPKAYIDTLSMARAVIGTRLKEHSLASVANYYGLAPKGFLPTDGLRELNPDQERALGEYCIHDTNLDHDILYKMLPHFPASQFAVMDWTVKAFINPTLVLDTQILRELHGRETERKANLFGEILKRYSIAASMVSPKENPRKLFSSNPRFAKLLQEYEFPVPTKLSPTALKKGIKKEIPALAVGDSDFQDMLESDNPTLVDLCEARVEAKSNTLETRSMSYLKVAGLGPWPFHMNFSGAKQTHRGSGGNGAGGNPQNLRKCQDPAEHKSGHECNGLLRAAVRAPEGWRMGVADFAGIELRISAWIAQEKKLMSAIIDGRSIYAEFASKIYGRPITKKDDQEYKFGKIAILGLGYGMGWKRFIYTVRLQADMIIDEERARGVVDLYRATYDRIKAYWGALEGIIPTLASCGSGPVPNAPFLKIVEGEIILPSGLALRYPNLRSRPGPRRDEWVYDIWRNGQKETTKLYGGKLLENICQAMAGEIKKVAISRCLDSSVWPAGEVHDELLTLFPAKDEEIAVPILRAAMETPMPWWSMLPLKAEIGTGETWLEAKV